MEDTHSKTDEISIPVLDSWETSVSMSVLGAIVGTIVLSVVSFIIGTTIGIDVSNVIFSAIAIVYARGFYPSYFSTTPMVRNPRVISFLNLAFGGILFGSLWNHNLTRKDVGMSHHALTVIGVLLIIAYWPL